jgi:hypothetical protein
LGDKVPRSEGEVEKAFSLWVSGFAEIQNSKRKVYTIENKYLVAQAGSKQALVPSALLPALVE